jgi:predicted SAM-dependent methyltransferase
MEEIRPKLSVLDVGSGPVSVTPRVFPDADLVIIRVDADPANNPDFVCDIRKGLPAELAGRFDIVYCSHVLEHIERKEVVNVVSSLASAVAPGGELWLLVPSLEWALDQTVKGNPSPVLQALIFGSQENEWQYHKSGFTLSGLRYLVRAVGLVDRRAYQSRFLITVSNPEEQLAYPALQNIVVAAKGVEDNGQSN